MKLIYLNTVDEMKVWIPKRPADYDWDSAGPCRVWCKNCKSLQYISLQFVEVYHGWHCPTCGVDNQEPVIVPDPATLFSYKAYWTFLYLN